MHTVNHQNNMYNLICVIKISDKVDKGKTSMSPNYKGQSIKHKKYVISCLNRPWAEDDGMTSPIPGLGTKCQVCLGPGVRQGPKCLGV